MSILDTSRQGTLSISKPCDIPVRVREGLTGFRPGREVRAELETEPKTSASLDLV